MDYTSVGIFARGSVRSGSSSIRSTSRPSTSRPSTSTKSTTSTKTTTSTKPSTSTSTKTTTTTTTKPKTGKSTAKPGTPVIVNGKVYKSNPKKPAKKDYTSSRGIVGDNGYSPHFISGYNPPYGSVVYYRDNSMFDYFFLYYLFSSNNPARPENQQAVVVQPNGKEIQAKPVSSGFDGMALINWTILIILVIVIIALIMYWVNKLSKKKPNGQAAVQGW